MISLVTVEENNRQMLDRGGNFAIKEVTLHLSSSTMSINEANIYIIGYGSM